MYSFPNFERVCCSMSDSNGCFLTCILALQDTDNVVWFSHLFKDFSHIIMIHTVKAFPIINEAVVDVFLEFFFFYDPTDVGNWTSDSSVFSKSSLYIWKFSVHVLLKPSLKDFEHYFASLWNECNCKVAWTFFGIALLGIEMKTDLCQSFGHCWVFKICCHVECSTITLSFRIWNSLTILSPPLALFAEMLL